MRILPFSWLFLIPFFTFLVTGLVSGQCLTDQRSLLLQLKKTLNFTSVSKLRLVNWTQSNDCCGWKGVTCDQSGHVTGLDLNSESINGGVNKNSNLFSLKFLERLNLAYNSLNSTPFPSSIGNLTNLVYLNLSNAGFSGQIPIELSHLTRLATLDLSIFSLSGILSLQIQNPNLSTLLQNLTGLTELRLDGVNISAPGIEWCQTISYSLPNLRVLSLSNCDLSGPIDSSLLKLRFLSEIHLGSNNLSVSVPEFFANFTNLTVLSLSSSNLEGPFPEKIFQVPTLQTLDLGNNRFLNGSLPEFLQNGSLQRLVLSNTNFSGRLPDSIGNLRNLSRVELSVCNFSGRIPNSMANLSHLVYLDFSSNNFTGPIPSFQMSKNLTYIDFSHNALTGPVPSSYFEGFSNLVNVDLAYNSFNGSIPLSLFYLPSLQKILLSNNQFGGQVAGLKNRSLSPLDTLDLSSNKLEGPIPSYFFDFGRLDILSLSFNHFSGTLQLERVRSLQNLTKLDLSYNNLSINASGSNSSLSSFPHLSTLRLASCKLQKFPPPMNLSRTIYLDLSDNQISGEIPDWIWNITSGNLMYLNLSCNLLVGMLRQYSFTSLNVIDLHSNQLHGEIPIPSQSVIYVDYSSNNFYSSIPAEIGNNLTFAIFFSLSNNNLTGVIPLSICNSINLQVLDLSSNRLSGTIPKCLIESRSATLGVLNLRNNNLTGNILGTFPESCALETLDFNRNLLEGHVPQSLTNCAKLQVLNLGNNNINDNFTCFLKNSSHLRVLNLRSNRFQGGIDCEGEQKNSWPKLQIIDLALNNFSGFLPQDCFLHWKAMMVDGGNAQSKLNHLHFKFLRINPFYYQDTVTVTIKGQQLELVKILTVFTSIDFSNNIFHGEIPYTVGALKYLYVLNLSHNFLTGDIPRSLGNLTQLESLDLSMNKLSGSIPQQLASLTFLSFLNLSFNQLVGRIPTGTQIQSFSETSFEGNEGLCGAPLNTCVALIPSTTPTSNESGSSLMTEFDWEVIYTGVGFGIGAGLLVGLLMFWEQGSHWCDKHIENFAWMILPTLGFIFSCCNDGKVESEGNIENPLDETGDSDEDEDATEDKAFMGQYCVFCSKLDICWEKVIHNPKCRCHESPPISTSSSFSSSSSS
ncbi:receptor-like protein 7 [Camellia sinensis]|uniref:receptor-like protein 7 n=1 Tax=Camellia sinensis TaxID=4442 RepID=UPI0010364FAC|nr:receptor-like protein 7 [Camellia sinensis]